MTSRSGDDFPFSYTSTGDCYAIGIVLPVVTIVITGLRLYTRRGIQHTSLGADDWLIVGGLIALIATGICFVYGMSDASRCALPAPTYPLYSSCNGCNGEANTSTSTRSYRRDGAIVHRSRIRATGKGTQQIARQARAYYLDTISIPNHHDAGIRLHEDEYRSLLSSSFFCQHEGCFRHHHHHLSGSRAVDASLHPPHHLSMWHSCLG